MLKTIRTATIIAGVSAFAIPAIAQDAIPNVPGSETVIEENNAATRDAVAAQPGAMMDAPVANPMNETIVPGSEAQIELNEAETRNAVAAGTAAEAQVQGGQREPGRDDHRTERDPRAAGAGLGRNLHPG